MSFKVKLNSGISRDAIGEIVVKVSSSANAAPVLLKVAPPLDTFEVCGFQIAQYVDC